MCLVIDPPKNNYSTLPVIAKEDIHVYKIIDNDDISLHHDFEYDPNTKYELGNVLFIKRYDKLNTIQEGFHSFATPQECFNCLRGRYSNSDCKAVKFIIPAGAKLYYGINDDIVSNQIVSGDLTEVSKGDLARA